MTPALIPELYVENIAQSITFYAVFGFVVAYERPTEHFAMLERDGAAIMIEKPIGRTFLARPLSQPRGSGVGLQIAVADAEDLWRRVPAGCIVVLPIETHAYSVAGTEVQVRQFVVADPDGYVLRFSERLA